MEVIYTDEFEVWFLTLEASDQNAVGRVVNLLATHGVNLGNPYSSAIATARNKIRELRTQSGGEPLRVFYAFDPKRDAVLLIGGNKTGDDRFYERMVPLADRIFDEYLAEQRSGRHEE